MRLFSGQRVRPPRVWQVCAEQYQVTRGEARNVISHEPRTTSADDIRQFHFRVQVPFEREFVFDPLLQQKRIPRVMQEDMFKRWQHDTMKTGHHERSKWESDGGKVSEFAISGVEMVVPVTA